MGFGVGKLPGVNNTHKKNMQKLIKQGYTPQEISDQLQIVLSCILSFYPLMGGEDKDWPTMDTSIPGNKEAIATAAIIIEEAKAEAAIIRAGDGDEKPKAKTKAA